MIDTESDAMQMSQSAGQTREAAAGRAESLRGDVRGVGILRGAGVLLLALAALLLLAACGGEGELEQPVPLYGNNPIEYPLDLWDEGAEGAAILRVRVDERGQVDSVEVAQSSGHEGLDAAAVAGARELRFEPGRKDGKRIRMWATLPVEFSTRPSPVDQD